jgi:hypothetical protein
MSFTYAIFGAVNAARMLIVTYIVLQAQFNLIDPALSDHINAHTSTSIRATVLSSISLIRSIGNLASKVGLGLAIAGVGVGGMFHIQAVYLFVGTIISYALIHHTESKK